MEGTCHFKAPTATANSITPETERTYNIMCIMSGVTCAF